MLDLLKKLEELRCNFLDRDNEVLELAEKCGPDVLQSVASCLVACAQTLDGVVKTHSYKLGEEDKLEFDKFCKEKSSVSEDEGEKSEEVTPKDLEAVAALAEEFSKSGDVLLRRQASVLDQVLLTFATQDVRQDQKKAFDQKIAQIKENLGKNVEEQIKKSFKADEVAKAVDKNIKVYAPLEAPLKTRSCIDHPGHQLIRVSDDVYQCSLDKRTYDYKSGFTTLKGNKVPGGDVSLQSRMPYEAYVNVPMSFHSKK